MSRRLALGLALLVASGGCAAPGGSSSWSSASDAPRSRCLTQPQRGQNYASDRPLFYLFCVESP